MEAHRLNTNIKACWHLPPFPHTRCVVPAPSHDGRLPGLPSGEGIHVTVRQPELLKPGDAGLLLLYAALYYGERVDAD